MQLVWPWQRLTKVSLHNRRLLVYVYVVKLHEVKKVFNQKQENCALSVCRQVQQSAVLQL